MDLPGKDVAVGLTLLSLFNLCQGFVLEGTSANYSSDCMDTLEQCDVLNKTLDLCNDFSKATLVCPKFCDICPIDGTWSSWTEWSKCPVTCGNGNRTRARACDSPAPAHRGADCLGSSYEHQTCDQNPCPVHGSWSLWSVWGTCSVTCGSGLERRDRYCNNPYPLSAGEYCYGDGVDYRICTEASCSAWASWSAWGSCSHTCGAGLMTRERNCTGAPSGQLNYCDGDSHGYQLCETTWYLLDGSSGNSSLGPDFWQAFWTPWSDWGTCSTTCGVGLQQRDRHCTKPHLPDSQSTCSGQSIEFKLCPATGCLLWQPWMSWSMCECGGMRVRRRSCGGAPPGQSSLCEGEAHDYSTCDFRCVQPPNTTEFFAETYRSETYSPGDIFIFDLVMFNRGYGYDYVTGIFTAPVKGTYMFYAKLCDMHFAHCGYALMHNDAMITNRTVAPNDGNINITATLTMASNDTAWVKVTSQLELQGGYFMTPVFYGTKLK